MFRINSDGLVVDAEDDQPVALVAERFFAAEATMQDKRYVIVRLACPDDAPAGTIVAETRIHQFALPLDLAGDLMRAILQIASREDP